MLYKIEYMKENFKKSSLLEGDSEEHVKIKFQNCLYFNKPNIYILSITEDNTSYEMDNDLKYFNNQQQIKVYSNYNKENKVRNKSKKEKYKKRKCIPAYYYDKITGKKNKNKKKYNHDEELRTYNFKEIKYKNLYYEMEREIYLERMNF